MRAEVIGVVWLLVDRVIVVAVIADQAWYLCAFLSVCRGVCCGVMGELCRYNRQEVLLRPLPGILAVFIRAAKARKSETSSTRLCTMLGG